MKTTVVCVLKVGGEYDTGHVARLAHQVREHSPPGTPFVCLTDDTMLGADFARPLQHTWPGWWSKLEIYRIPGPCLYLDLDVTVVGEIVAVARRRAGARPGDAQGLLARRPAPGEQQRGRLARRPVGALSRVRGGAGSDDVGLLEQGAVG